MITGTRNMQLNIILSIFALTLIPACYGVEAECKTTTKGREYTGILSVTEHGLQCQRWDAKTPHHPVPSIIAISNFPPGTGTLDKAENYCRNPDSDARPWCYTMDPKVKYQFCDIPFCPETTTPKSTTTSTTQSPTTPPAKGECVCVGDPHCFQFDTEADVNKDIYITNVCSHILATDHCSSETPMTFYVAASFDRAKGIGSTRTYANEIFVYTLDDLETLVLGQGMTVEVEGSTQTVAVPSTVHGFTIQYVVPPPFTDIKGFPPGTTQVLSVTIVSNGVEVQFDGVKTVKVIYPAGMTENCGLCGNNDGVLDENDLLKGYNTFNTECPAYNTPGTAFTLANNEVEFINSWFSRATDDEACQEVCSPVT